MAGTRSQNTMAEALRGLLGQIAEMKAMPDADIAYLNTLETQVLGFLRAPIDRQVAEMQAGQQALGTGGGATAQLLGLGGPAPAPMGPPQGPQGMGGAMQGLPTAGPADELRRALTQTF